MPKVHKAPAKPVPVAAPKPKPKVNDQIPLGPYRDKQSRVTIAIRARDDKVVVLFREGKCIDVKTMPVFSFLQGNSHLPDYGFRRALLAFARDEYYEKTEQAVKVLQIMLKQTRGAK